MRKILLLITHGKGFPGAAVVKNPPAKHETQLRPLDWEDPLEEEMATSVFLPGKSHG